MGRLLGDSRQPPNDSDDVRLLRLSDVAARYGLPQSKLRKAIKNGIFPLPAVTLGPRSHYWSRAQLEAWEATPAAAAFIRASLLPVPRRTLSETLERAAAPLLRPFFGDADTVQKTRRPGRPRRKP